MGHTLAIFHLDLLLDFIRKNSTHLKSSDLVSSTKYNSDFWGGMMLQIWSY